MRGKNLTGQRFGKLTALEPTEERRSNSVVWKCQCDCGAITYVVAKHLKSGNTKSCGCSKTADITGQRFGKLVAIKPTEERRGGEIVWECRCDCGNTAFVSNSKLKTGDIKSCGCLRGEKSVDISGQRFGRLVAIAPTKKRSKDGNVLWECKCDCGRTTIENVHSLKTGRTQSCGCLTRELSREKVKDKKMGTIMGTNIIAISKDDTILRSTNSSGYTGVCFNKSQNAWSAYCGFKGYQVQKMFKKIEDAIAARKKMKAIRDEFVEWYNSLSEEEKEREISEYDGNNDYFKKLFKERMDNLF